MKVAITGHRVQALTKDQWKWSIIWLDAMAGWLQQKDELTQGITGMALGADTYWAHTLERNNVPFHAYVPQWGQPKRWPAPDQAEWLRLLGVAEDVHISGPAKPYSPKWFHARNNAMVADCDIMLVIKDHNVDSGGTYHCFKALRQANKPWHWYDPVANKVYHGTGEQDYLDML